MITVCPKYESDGTTLSPLAGQAVVATCRREGTASSRLLARIASREANSGSKPILWTAARPTTRS